MLCGRRSDSGFCAAGQQTTGDPGNYLGHFSAYSLAMVALAGVANFGPWATAVGLTFLGVGIEFVQPAFDRENHWQDMLANAAGVGIGWLTIVVWRQTAARK